MPRRQGGYTHGEAGSALRKAGAWVMADPSTTLKGEAMGVLTRQTPEQKQAVRAVIRSSQVPCASLVLSLSTAVAVFPPFAAAAPTQSDLAGARGAGQGYDLALSQSLSRQRVPFGGTVREVLRVTNRGSVTVP